MPSLLIALRATNAGYLCAVLITLLGKPTSLFTFHPISMVLYWTLLCEGIIIQKQKKPSIHRWFAVTATIAALVGASIMYQVKENRKSEHFTTTHGLYGSLIATVLIGQVTGGMFFFGSSKSKIVWYFHRVFGYLMCIGTWYVGWLHMGAENGWFMGNESVKENLRLMGLGRSSYIMSAIFVLFVAFGK